MAVSFGAFGNLSCCYNTGMQMLVQPCVPSHPSMWKGWVTPLAFLSRPVCAQSLPCRGAVPLPPRSPRAVLSSCARAAVTAGGAVQSPAWAAAPRAASRGLHRSAPLRAAQAAGAAGPVRADPAWPRERRQPPGDHLPPPSGGCWPPPSRSPRRSGPAAAPQARDGPRRSRSFTAPLPPGTARGRGSEAGGAAAPTGRGDGCRETKGGCVSASAAARGARPLPLHGQPASRDGVCRPGRSPASLPALLRRGARSSRGKTVLLLTVIGGQACRGRRGADSPWEQAATVPVSGADAKTRMNGVNPR